MQYPWLDELNPEQREAATYGEGPLLIVARAGTGKTKTLVSRVSYLLSEGVQPERILLLTFTRRAAEWEKPWQVASSRFNYLYSESELQEWVPRIGDLASQTRQMHMVFNNCYGDKAVVNAAQTTMMLASSHSHINEA